MKSFKPFNGTRRLELDLREEMNRFMFGANDEIAKGALYILRVMRRNDGVEYPTLSTDLERCDCTERNYQKEPDKEYPCEICDGEGYLFDDKIVPGYKSSRFEYQDIEKYKSWGKNTVSMSFFYIEYPYPVSRFDKVIEPIIDIDGHIVTPVKIHHRHNIHMAERFRSDFGRTEYWRCSCSTD